MGGPFQTALAAYAAHDPGCLASVFQTADSLYTFSIYGPIIMMLQARVEQFSTSCDFRKWIHCWALAIRFNGI